MQFTRPLHCANVSFSALNTANWKKANRFPTLLAQPLGTAEAWRIDMAEFYEEKKKKEKTTKAGANTPSSPSAAEETAFRIGDPVILPNKAIGEIIGLDGKNAVVALGNLRTNVKISQLQKVSASQAKKMVRSQPQASYANIRENISQKRMNFKPDIDLRGLRGDEALQRVIGFLDEAVMLNYKEVRLLHGTGTGALRQLLRQYLSTNPLVASYADEQVQLGGAGITVVQLDI